MKAKKPLPRLFFEGVVLGLMLFGISLHAFGETMTVDGKTYPVHSWIKPTTPQLPLSKQAIQTAAAETANLPVKSEGLSGLATGALPMCAHFKLQKTRAPHVPSPLVVVGEGKHSKQFLIQNFKTLKTLQAKVLVVSVKSAKAFQQLRKQFYPLDLLPVSGAGVKQQFGLSCYPALIVPSKPRLKNSEVSE